jgi:Transcription factor WhiB
VNDWHADAACRGHGSIWFAGEAFAAAVAARICRSCPVRADCARAALELYDAGVPVVGVWAGVRLRGDVGRTGAVTELAKVANGCTQLAPVAPMIAPNDTSFTRFGGAS